MYAEKGTQKVLKITLVNTAHFLRKKDVYRGASHSIRTQKQ